MLRQHPFTACSRCLNSFWILAYGFLFLTGGGKKVSYEATLTQCYTHSFKMVSEAVRGLGWNATVLLSLNPMSVKVIPVMSVH